MADCPSDAQVAAFVERTLGEGERTALESHVFACESCREAIAHVVAASDGPRQLGRYRLDRIIGSGGMGVVWDAWDPALERRLAIKLLRAELTDDSGRARLIREARTLAKLQHPHVVAVHDVGEVDGEVFIATELIDGEPMAQWQHGQRAPAVLDAYAQAARGLRAVHELGLVHRDVKPSNIFVGRDGRVRVGDFGLATRDRTASAATGSDSSLTSDGQVVGTPAYMAPEQRAGKQVDERADQYSLCLALSEALLGERPAAGATAAELSARGVAAPWAAIARGLAKDPAARFADLRPLVAALDRQPVRRWPWIAGAAVAIVAVGAFALLRDGGRDCPQVPRLAWEPAKLRAAFAASKLSYAADAATTTLAALDGFSARFAVEDHDACVAGGERRAACLERIRDQVGQLVGELSAAPDALTIQRAASSVRSLPDPGVCNTAGGLGDQVVAGDATQLQRFDAAIGHAAMLRRLGKLDASKAETLTIVAAAKAANLLPAVADAQHELGTVLLQLDDRGAEAMLEEALATAATAHADLTAARISALLVEVVGVKGDVAAAERQARLARPAILRAGVDKYLDGVVERGLGHTAQQAKQYASAYDHYKKAEELHRAIGELDDVDFDRRFEVVALGSLERIDEAVKINDALLASDRANLGAKHPRTLRDLTSAALLLFKAGRFAASATLLEQAVPIDEAISGKASIHAANTRAQLGAAYLQIGRIADAEPLFRATVAAFAAARPATDTELRGQRMNLAAIQIVLGNYAEAETALGELVELARAEHDDESLGLVLQNLGDALIRDGKLDRGLAAAQEAIEHDRKVPGAGSRMEAEATVTIGNGLLAQGKRAPAIAAYERAVALFEKSVGPDTAELGDPLTSLGELRGDAPLLERAVKLLASGDPVDLARARFALGRVRDDRTEVTAADGLLAAAGDRAKAKRAATQAWLAAHH